VKPYDVVRYLVRPEGIAIPVHLVEYAGQRLALDRVRSVEERARLLSGDLVNHLSGQLVKPGRRRFITAVETNNECEHPHLPTFGAAGWSVP
jgi:hypothetical protein